jgi:phospholipid/cholesterol/gamma-HCH transport system substrate-binding protein
MGPYGEEDAVRAAALRPLAGLATIAAVAGAVGVSAYSFQDGFRESATITVMAPRAGLVMNPDAKVQFHGVQVGKVAGIDERTDGSAAIRLAMDPGRLQTIPANAVAEIASTTVFGAKNVQFILPADPARDSLRPGQVIDSQQVMVEVNTIFGQLVSVLSTIAPEKLNETLGAIAAATGDNGQQVGTMLSNLNSALRQFNSHSSALNTDLSLAPMVFQSYADAAPDLMSVVRNATTIGATVVSQEQNLDAMLLGTIGLAGVGNDLLTSVRQPFTDAVRLLTPTTELTNQYNDALRCALGGVARMATNPPLTVPGVEILAGFMWGQERYRYPDNIPKVAAKGGPQCTDLPVVPFDTVPPFVVTDVGANPWKNTNPGIMLNADGIKSLLLGPLSGPPRNTAQIGQPG